MKIEWEYLTPQDPCATDRLKVPGGWLIRVGASEIGISAFFMPDPTHEWQDGWEEKRKMEHAINVESYINRQKMIDYHMANTIPTGDKNER